jgi:Asp-tRNA(Asn)/Glu-tRNA(Gln) amidotransferase A subunit family amidase
MARRRSGGSGVENGSMLTRKEFMGLVVAGAALGRVPINLNGGTKPADEITLDDLQAIEKIAGLAFTEEQRKQLLESVRAQNKQYAALRELPITYQVEPPTVFRPLPGRVGGASSEPMRAVPRHVELERPTSDDDLAFLPLRELAHLVRLRKISPVELTQVYLRRLETYGDRLLAVTSLTPERALAKAKEAEQEIARGDYRGPLHGIPCGVKDLFAMRGTKTTWGSEPHKDQEFDYDAAVVERLDQAGAIIVAKLSLGALAQGDVWFRGRTRSPWNPAQGSSGSSAGSGAATAAGLVGFSIGTETLGSIVSPSHQSRVTGLRPTYGRISRYGGMAVSWTMDKVGPMCRQAEDCALVLAALAGSDPRDPSAVDRPFSYPPEIDLRKLKIGYLIGAEDDPNDRSRLEREDYLKALVELGARLEPIKITPTSGAIGWTILAVESAAAFDDFTRSEEIQLLKNSSWPHTYRAHRYVPAVEYLQMQRARTLLMHQFEQELSDFDMFVAPGVGAHTLLVTNYTGHPQILIPNGEDARGNPRSVSIIGRLYEEAPLVAVAQRLQEALGHLPRRPDLSKLPESVDPPTDEVAHEEETM